MDFDNLNIGDELREKAKACKTPDELLALAKKEGYTLSDEEMLAAAKLNKEPEDLCRSLMAMALERGARDNVTVVAVK